MTRAAWLDELEALCERYRETGAGADLAAMNEGERWQLLQNLRRKFDHETLSHG